MVSMESCKQGATSVSESAWFEFAGLISGFLFGLFGSRKSLVFAVEFGKILGHFGGWFSGQERRQGWGMEGREEGGAEEVSSW